MLYKQHKQGAKLRYKAQGAQTELQNKLDANYTNVVMQHDSSKMQQDGSKRQEVTQDHKSKTCLKLVIIFQSKGQTFQNNKKSKKCFFHRERKREGYHLFEVYSLARGLSQVTNKKKI